MKDLGDIVINGKYRLQRRIGSGSYGIVYAAQHCYTGGSYAVKIILKNNSTNTANNKQLLVELEKNLVYQAMVNNGTLRANLLNLDLIERHGANCRFLREISLQLKVHKHPNVLSIYKVYDFENSIFVVMDYYPEGDLFATIVDKQRYKDDPFLVKSIFIQMVDAINYCHSKQVFHCDLKPENVLVANNGTRVVLADFGLALQERLIDSNISCGSSYYMAPERIQNFSQGFNTLESHSIHLERLLDPGANQDGLVRHGNVKFPTAAGDVWSLCIILINLVCIRNPWLKASFHDPTFKAFVANPKILMKILPISSEIYAVLMVYLRLNPWERGELVQFRSDVLHCNKLTETGPLSINSSLGALEVITTESQRLDLDSLTVCPVPFDHVALERKRSRENIIESVEVENNYIPQSIKNDPLNEEALQQEVPMLGAQHSPNCTGCPECTSLDFNHRFGGGNESGTSLMTLSTSYSNYSGTGDSTMASFSEHQAQLETAKRKAHEAHEAEALRVMEAERDRRVQQEHTLHLERKRQREAYRQQQKALESQRQREHQGTLFSKLFKHHQPGMSGIVRQQAHAAQVPPQVHAGKVPLEFQAPAAPPSAPVPVIAPEYTNLFPMPGMGHHTKPIMSQAENRRKKFITKRRQRKPTVSGTVQPQVGHQEQPPLDSLPGAAIKGDAGGNSSASLNTLSTSTLSALVSESTREILPEDGEVQRVGRCLSHVSLLDR